MKGEGESRYRVFISAKELWTVPMLYFTERFFATDPEFPTINMTFPTSLVGIEPTCKHKMQSHRKGLSESVGSKKKERPQSSLWAVWGDGWERTVWPFIG
jgi:hypothetical protein